jgi:hypothetical protein
MPPTNPRCQDYSPIVGITVHFATKSKLDLITPKMRLPSTCPFAKASSPWPSPRITSNTSSLLQSFCHRLFPYVLGEGSSWHIHRVSSPVLCKNERFQSIRPSLVRHVKGGPELGVSTPNSSPSLESLVFIKWADEFSLLLIWSTLLRFEVSWKCNMHFLNHGSGFRLKDLNPATLAPHLLLLWTVSQSNWPCQEG